MSNKIYDMFRFLISDNATGGYALPDLMALTYLDSAITKLSEITDYTFEETKILTQTDINNQFFTLTHDIIEFTRFPMRYMHITWEYGDNIVRMVMPNAFLAGYEYLFFYRAMYTRFKGQWLDDSVMDYPKQANIQLGIVLYALGLYTQAKGIYNAKTGEFGLVLNKSEDGLHVQYGMPGWRLESFSPEGLMDRGVELMRQYQSTQNMFFSVKN